MTSKKVGGLLMKLIYTVHMLLFLKKLTYVSLCYKDLKNHLLMKVNIKKFLKIHLQTTKISTKNKK